MPIEHVSSMPIIEGKAPAIDQYKRIPDLAMTMKTVAKTADYTLLPEDSGKVFLANGSGTLTFTLPAVTNTGFIAWFVNGVDQNMVVASAEGDNIIADGDAEADSIAFSTSSHKVGGMCCVVSNGTKWLILQAGLLSAVPTIAS